MEYFPGLSGLKFRWGDNVTLELIIENFNYIYLP
jgi:hypothetical protein